ncbi:MAG: hypothetical protein OXN83_01430 [Oligoflexia bacterium]|nr:hypothetical protein [Oligoflexia bacterium]
MKYNFSLIIIFLNSCFFVFIENVYAKPVSNSRSLRFDLSLIRQFENINMNKEPCRRVDPFVIRYSDKGNIYSLWYVGARHGPVSQNPTFLVIDWLFQSQDWKPRVIIFEGYPHSFPASEYKNKASICQRNCGESEYLVYSALKFRIPFTGAEPSPGEIRNHLYRKGYSDDDYIGLQVIRTIISGRRKEEIRAIIPGRKIEEQIKQKSWNRLLRDFDVGELIGKRGYKDFLKWFHHKLGKAFNINNMMNIDRNYIRPHSTGNYTQRLSAYVDELRERTILKIVERSLNTYKKVLIVYGSSHHAKHRFVLEKAFSGSYGNEHERVSSAVCSF